METPGICLLLALGLPLLGGPLLALSGRKLGPRVGWLALAFPLISTGALLALAANVNLPVRLVIEWPWVPIARSEFLLSRGWPLDFLRAGRQRHGVPGFFSRDLLPRRRLRTPWAVLLLPRAVHGAMLGTVFANHLVLLFIFWELTGVASFLLIGFLHEEEGSRIGARQALLVTGATGLALFAGMVLLQQLSGTASLADLLANKLPWAQHGTALTIAMVLVLVGAFGKSAQFPFHFWLPNAMAAPTPVSAYLHSATMVKLGVFLVARFYPLFMEHQWWARC
jgi:NADH:ubiquinone oxidoreductase subunit 5 (subunit L)/multisubunit Na+/H+ antiporter MnhA subunit